MFELFRKRRKTSSAFIFVLNFATYVMHHSGVLSHFFGVVEKIFDIFRIRLSNEKLKKVSDSLPLERMFSFFEGSILLRLFNALSNKPKDILIIYQEKF
jgi:hypothetical protein